MGESLAFLCHRDECCCVSTVEVRSDGLMSRFWRLWYLVRDTEVRFVRRSR